MANAQLSLQFHGGAKEVTGSCYRVASPQTAILVDCGMFQGSRYCEKLNFERFHFDPSGIAAVFVTHSHIDHIGRLPKLIKEGFTGTIYSTEPTMRMAELMFEDALGFMDEPGEALYTKDDVAQTLRQWHALEYYVPQEIADLHIILRNSGHILGSAMVEIIHNETKILFTGDFGNSPSVLLPPPDEMPQGVDYLVIESTYGNRTHEDVENRALQLERAVEDVVTRGGTLMIPAFATERTQDILFELNGMVMNNRVPHVPVFVDSPLAIRVTEVFRQSKKYYSGDVKKLEKKDPHVLDFRGLTFTESVAQSKAINDVPPPKVIIAGSGMSTGGRILHHERRYLSDKNSILMLVGYQSHGSLGRRLMEGAREVTLFHEKVPVRAEIRVSGGYSAHADEPQLFEFIKRGREGLKKVFMVQGEEEAAHQLEQDVKDRLGVLAETPSLYEEVFLE